MMCINIVTAVLLNLCFKLNSVNYHKAEITGSEQLFLNFGLTQKLTAVEGRQRWKAREEFY